MATNRPIFRRLRLPRVGWRQAVGLLDGWEQARAWRGPSGDFIVGLGEAMVFSGASLAENIERFRQFVGHEAELGAVALVAVSFDPDRAAAPEWSAFRRAEVVVPRALIKGGADGFEALICAPASEHRGLEDRLRNAFEDLASRVASRGGGDAVVRVDWRDDLYHARVEHALRALEGPRLCKVVVARRLQVERDSAWSASVVLRRLSDEFPDCFAFAVRRGRATFLGASPERLVRVREGEASTGALAGSAARGEDTDEDLRLERALLASSKDLAEHQVVAEMITESLAPLSRRIRAASAPRVRKLSNVQHLWTPINAELLAAVGFAGAATRLHPTPAVGAMPVDEARPIIRALEGFDRGLYAGFVGWVDARGHGDSAVAIRSGLLMGARAFAYAGAGIVPQSDPDAEVSETRTKLRAVLSALGGFSDG